MKRPRKPRRPITVERRAIAIARVDHSGHLHTPDAPTPVCDRPIAREVASALAGGPIRFPGEWFRGGES